MKYNFDEVIERRGTQSSKWDNVGARVGNAEALPMWVADMDFACPRPVVEAVIERAQHPVYGYTCHGAHMTLSLGIGHSSGVIIRRDQFPGHRFPW